MRARSSTASNRSTDTPVVSAVPEANWLLAALSKDAYARLSALSETVTLHLRDVIHQPDTEIGYAYFPQSGCLSVVAVMSGEHDVEIGTIGWEGMFGLPVLNGVRSMSAKCIVQVAGAAKRVPRAAFEKELRESKELAPMLAAYAEAWMNQIGRSGACNAVHSVNERFARWLLMTHDRVATNVVPLTQEFLATMLGVRRASVTLAALEIQKSGVIEYRRGKITVLDRGGLEAASCECYKAIQHGYDLMPVTPLVRHEA